MMLYKSFEVQKPEADSLGQESRAEWEESVFTDFETDQEKINAYLESLFGKNATNRQATKALDKIKKKIEAFEIEIAAPGQFNIGNLRWVINGLLSAGLLSEEKNAVLKDFLASTVILTEVADVLNMRMSSIDTWSWEAGVPIEQRRHVTGAYHSRLIFFSLSSSGFLMTNVANDYRRL